MPVIPNLGTLGTLAAVPQAAMNYPVRNVAGIDVVDLAGGLFVMGGPGLNDAPAHWTRVSPFAMGRRPVTGGDFGPIMGRDVTEEIKGHPVVHVSALEADQFIAEFNKRNGTQFGSPTEAEWEYAARGEVVDLRARMGAEGIKEADFADWVEGRFENIFAHCLGSTIYADPMRKDFQAVLKSAARIYGYSVFGHPEGLDGGKVWYNKDQITSVTDEAAERRASSFNLIDMIGNVLEWVADRYDENAYSTLSPIDPVSEKEKSRVYRGGSGFDDDPVDLRAAYRDGDHPGDRDYNLGFRVALAGPQDSPS